MLTLDIQHNGSTLSLELPIPTEILAGELRMLGIGKTLNHITQDEFTLRPMNELGEHFMKMVQPDDTLQAIATYCRELDLLYGESRIALKGLLLADRFKDLSHMANYLQYGSDTLNGLIRMDYNGQSIVLPAAMRDMQDRFGFNQSMGTIRLSETELRPVSELGKQLMAELQPYSDTIATANAACAVAQYVPDITAAPAQIVEGARKIQAPMPTETVSFICPLVVSVEDNDDKELVEGDPFLLVEHEDEISEALKSELAECENMADYLPDTLKPKIASMEWDVIRVQGQLYGSIYCALRVPLTVTEQAGLVDWITGQNSDGLGEGFEQRPVYTDDGELFVHLWHGGDDYFVLPAEEFFQQLHEQTMGMNGMEGMT